MFFQYTRRSELFWKALVGCYAHCIDRLGFDYSTTSLKLARKPLELKSFEQKSRTNPGDGMEKKQQPSENTHKLVHQVLKNIHSYTHTNKMEHVERESEQRTRPHSIVSGKGTGKAKDEWAPEFKGENNSNFLLVIIE